MITTKDFLKNLHVGSKVVVRKNSIGFDTKYQVLTIVSESRTLFKTDHGTRFRKEDGRILGVKPYRFAIELSDSVKKDMRVRDIKAKLESNLDTLNDFIRGRTHAIDSKGQTARYSHADESILTQIADTLIKATAILGIEQEDES
jgi:hypothetical protein